MSRAATPATIIRAELGTSELIGDMVVQSEAGENFIAWIHNMRQYTVANPCRYCGRAFAGFTLTPRLATFFLPTAGS